MPHMKLQGYILTPQTQIHYLRQTSSASEQEVGPAFGKPEHSCYSPSDVGHTTHSPVFLSSSVIMAAVGVEVSGSWILSGGIGFFIVLLLLSIFLTALCSDCRGHSFELRDSDADRNPSALIRVVKLEESGAARDNPMIREIQNDEKDVQTDSSAAVVESGGDSAAEAVEKSVEVLLWRSHLRESQKQGVNGSAPREHIYHTIGLTSPSTNEGQEDRGGVSSAQVSCDKSRNLVYAQVSRKGKQATPPVHTPEAVQVDEEESSPPLPDRKSDLEQ
ncbi:uncharacterized protein LOC115041322 isoform X1 [Echeneis naucrates]|uniref:uncharacterized protein LOC115041322 isoform X1 n=2 Tax=Echeneis naucrates TaxID=173247 RepID=UPI00111465A1|nr:uncharacterized protein LOC115041322 isoform X1 [Echeneis naucrates]XP_029354556.1 uncharacterized protein LOC115041322 isoform X1 [Echeneis naucrates]